MSQIDRLEALLWQALCKPSTERLSSMAGRLGNPASPRVPEKVVVWRDEIRSALLELLRDDLIGHVISQSIEFCDHKQELSDNDLSVSVLAAEIAQAEPHA